MKRVELEGCVAVIEDDSVCFTDSLKPGDNYIAKRNTGWRLLTCREVVYYECASVHGRHPCCGPGGKHPDHVYPVEPGYAYDAWESFKVLEIVY